MVHGRGKGGEEDDGEDDAGAEAQKRRTLHANYNRRLRAQPGALAAGRKVL